MRRVIALSVVTAVVLTTAPSMRAGGAMPQAAAERLIVEAHDLRKQNTSEANREAVVKLREAAALFEAGGDRRAAADALNELGEVQFSLGQVDEARATFERQLPLRRAVGDTRGEGDALNSIGVTLRVQGDSRRALTYYNQALPLLRAAGDRANEAQTLSNIGVAHAILNENREALTFFEQALPLRRATGDQRGEGATLHSIGAIYFAFGDYEQALRYALDAVALRRAAGDRAGEANTLHSLGMTYQALEDFDTALTYYEDDLAIRKAIGDRLGEGYVLHSIGDLHLARRQLEEARAYLEQALPLRRAVRDQIGESDTLYALGALHAEQGDTAEAMDLFNQSLAIRRTIGNRRGEAATLASRARLERQLGRLQGARADIEAALTIHESLRADVDRQDLRASYLATSRGAFELYVDILMQLHRASPTAGHALTALAASERSRARSLLEMLAQANATMQSELDAGPIDAAEIQRAVVDDDSVLVEYLLGDERSFVWVVTRGSVDVVELPNRSTIEAVARRMYGLLSAGAKRETRRQLDLAAAELGQLILAPIANRLGAKRVLIVPDGALHYVPFAAIPMPGGRAAPLMASHEVVMLPSASTAALVRRSRASRVRASDLVAVVADPVFDRADPRVKSTGRARSDEVVTREVTRSAVESGVTRFERLPFARREADAIVRAVGSSGRAFAAVDFDASRATVLSPALAHHSIVHFATHGLLNNQHPDLSGIVLSLVDREGQPQDGFLRVRDIYGMKLDADLVVLSACRTALGKDIRGEGLVGLTRGFMYAGARSVVASLWDVRDEATAEFMSRFYRALLQQGVGPAAALREAQRSMLRDSRWQSPYYWAGFVLQGDWN